MAMCTVSPTSLTWENLVDPAALEVPFDYELRSIDPTDAALLLDGALRRISVVRGAMERQVGRRLLALKRGEAFKKLGLSTQADYIIERTGMGVRSAQEMMRVAGALQNLPLLRHALDHGTLSASHVGHLVRVADPGNEAAWIEKARELTVRALAIEVRQAIAEARNGGGRAPKAEEDESTERVSFAAPELFPVKWMAAVELFKKLEGHDGLADGAAVEAFVAEWQAGVGPVPATVEAAGEKLPGYEREAQSRAGIGAELDALRKYLELETGRWSFLSAEFPAVELPAGLGDLDGELSDDPRELDRELREINLRILSALTGRILLTMSRLGLFRAMRFTDLAHYAVERLGMSPRKARELKRLERQLFELPLLQKAYFAGELGDAKMRLLVRVATSRTESLWYERARRVTVRRLEDEVRWAESRNSLRTAGHLGPTAQERELGFGQVAPPPEGCDVRRETEVLTELARENGNRHTFAPQVPQAAPATVSFAAEPEVAQLWREAVALARALADKPLADWECADRFVDAFFAEWERKDPYGAVLAHKVIARDGYRCTVPGCRSRRNLQAHHIIWKSRGGTDAMSSMTSLCARHHLGGVHEGWVEVTGEAPDHLVWRLGVRNHEALWTVGPGEVIAEGQTDSCSA